MTTTTQMGVADGASSVLSEDDAADVFMSRWSEEDPETASQATEGDDAVTETDETGEGEAENDNGEAEGNQEDPPEGDEGNDEGNDEGDNQEAPKGTEVGDDVVVKIKVGDDEKEVSVKDLKRLYGQEAALTKKSQQVADQRKEVEAANQRAAAQLDRIHQKVAARWEPYSKIDMMVASKQLDTEQFTALRAEAQAAWDDYRFITQEVDQFVKASNEQRQTAIKAQALAAVDTLKERIPGWNQQVYDDVRAYAEKAGMAKVVIDGIADPFALEMIHKAMQFDKAKSIVTKKVNKTPVKVLKTNTAVTSKDTKVDKTQAAAKRLKASGSTDDAADMFLARWAK